MNNLLKVSSSASYSNWVDKDAIGRVVFNFIKPGEDMVRISRSWEICCGRWSIRATWWTLPSRLFKIRSRPFLVFSRVEKWGYGARSIRETWWNFLECGATSSDHENALLDGNAQSVRYGEIIHDGSGQLDSLDHQEKADSEIFVMGICEKSKRSSAKKTEKEWRTLQTQGNNIQQFGEWSWLRRWMRRHSWERISWIIKIPPRIPQISPWRKCSTSQRNCWTNKKRLLMWTRFIGKNIDGNICRWLVMKPLSIFNAQKSTSSRILCCASGGSINILSPTKLGRKGLNGSSLTKATETMTESMESRPNSSGTSSQDSIRCSSMVKSKIYWAD